MALKDKFAGKEVPGKQKIALYVLLFLGIVVVYYFIFYSPVRQSINTLQKQKVTLEGKIREQKIIAKNLAGFKREVAKLEIQLNTLLEQLPNSSEIPKLLRNISDVGKDNGLEFLKFAPKGESAREFYAEIPVDIAVNGGFHDFGSFLESVSRLPRIVNISNVVFANPRISGDKAEMMIRCTAKTFRFVKKGK